ncbi:MAG TPA: hypothetical protein VM841_02560 [Actinomycetota bacterium]|nr:hypothetical protein [Actinomycetota bacterium]
MTIVTFAGDRIGDLRDELAGDVRAVDFQQMRLNALAVGNLFGSNVLNMAILLFVDAAHTKGPVLTLLGQPEIVAGVGAILLMAIALAVIVHGAETRIARMEPDALVLLLAYAGCVTAVWAAGS